ncbi:MAG: hypothetical protein AAGG48_14675 [Planctomycetota bacterium]
MARSKPRSQSMQYMRKHGYVTGETETFNAYTEKRHDLFGFIDFIAMGNGEIVGVQCCAKSSLASHRRKIGQECFQAAKTWLSSGGRIEIHAWDRRDNANAAKTPKTAPTYQGRVNRLWVEPVTLERLVEYSQIVGKALPPAITADEVPF